VLSNAKTKGTAKQRTSGQSVTLVRYPDKQGVERFVDPDLQSKLDDI